jgi:hypothetical protein
MTLEETLREAFEGANQRRQSVGLHTQNVAKKDLITRGPAKGLPRGLMLQYKATVWMEPWEYADLLRLRDYLGWTGGVTRLLKKLVRDALPASARSARPEKPGEAPTIKNGHGRRSKLRAAA